MESKSAENPNKLRFCPNCNNLLVKVSSPDSLHYQCSKCINKLPPGKIDTILHQTTKAINLLAHSKILKNAGKDPTNPKIKVTCHNKKCNSKRAAQVRLRNMSLINVCCTCGTPWLHSLDQNDDE